MLANFADSREKWEISPFVYLFVYEILKTSWHLKFDFEEKLFLLNLFIKLFQGEL